MSGKRSGGRDGESERKGKTQGKERETGREKQGETAVTGCGLGEKMRKMVREADEA